MRHAGFTLVELLLTLGLMVVLGAVVLIGLDGGRVATLNEGGRRVESLLRSARAESALRGRRLRLAFEPVDGTDEATISVEWEPDPIDAGGEFVPFDEGMWQTYLPDDLVRVVRCRLTGPDEFRSMALDTEADSDFAEVMFYPDGSSDSAEIVLVSTDAEDPRGIVVNLDGLVGSTSRSTLTEDELDQWLTDE